MNRYPKRLIEVDLPIKQISEHARKEKNLRQGHPWHLHIWWARRPWGACRAIILSSLIPAPTDPNCPQEFLNDAYNILSKLPFKPNDKSPQSIQKSLLRFVGESARWEFWTNHVMLNAAKDLIKASYPNISPVLLDSFAGYGAIPGEAARLGCESIASDLNPVAVLCLSSILESVPKHGHYLIDKVKEGAEFIKNKARERLSDFYPTHEEKEPIAWLWARTVICEGPGCGAEIPLISQSIIAKGKIKSWIEIQGNPNTKKINIQIKQGSTIPNNLIKTAGGGHAVCPVCGFTTNKENVKKQANSGKMGQRLFGKVLAIGHKEGKKYINASVNDQSAYNLALSKWNILFLSNKNNEIIEKYPYHDPRAFTAGLYGIRTWGDLFSPRQKLALYTIGNILADYRSILKKEGKSSDFIISVVTILALAVSNSMHYQTTMSTWLAEHMISCFITGNAIAMRWDWAEANPLISEYVGGIDYSFKQAIGALESCLSINDGLATVMKSDATELSLPDDSFDIYFTDPPYYDVVPYADLSDLCYVWLKRFLVDIRPDIFIDILTPKEKQIVVNPYAINNGRGNQSPEYYQARMTKAFIEGRRVLKPNGIGAIVFAHKGTSAWETLLSSILDAGFIVTASWPIDTERTARMRANKSASLGSSVHIIVRPRENQYGYLRTDEVGDWRDILAELPKRIHEWMPRLAAEGVVGADAIFSCLGPALEIFSRYSSVEKASGEKVELKEYLEHVWAAVAREALYMIFEGADASGFEEDARLTAMWLWTLRTSLETDTEDDESKKQTTKISGYDLEYDAARKIAQGLGAHLENLKHLVEIKGNTATLLSAGARTKYLFGKDASVAPTRKIKEISPQKELPFMKEFIKPEEESTVRSGDFAAKEKLTILDQLHQTMILFGSGRSEALKRFLIDEGIGRNPLYWRLAQSLSALYPPVSEEKRWVDGVLARKKGLGF